MADLGANPAPLPEPLQTSELPPESIDRPAQPSTLSQEPVDYFDGWDAIGEQQELYNEQDCLYPSHNLASEKLKSRGDNDVVIFGYTLNPDYLKNVDGNPPVGGGPSSRHSAADHDVFFRVPKNELTTSEPFEKIINTPTELPLQLSRESRLGIMYVYLREIRFLITHPVYKQFCSVYGWLASMKSLNYLLLANTSGFLFRDFPQCYDAYVSCCATQS